MDPVSYHIAQINVARMHGVNMDDPIMQEFKDNLDRVNALAESSDGFVWRLKDDSNNASSFDPYDDEQIIVNISVWEDLKTLEAFTYKTFHSEFVRRRKEWFQKFGKAYFALWWVQKGMIPTIDECVERLEYLQQNGPTEKAFTFKQNFSPPAL